MRWKTTQEQSHDQGTRDPTVLIENLVLKGDLPQNPVVLYDDIMTSGGHIRACSQYLTDNGFNVLLIAIGGKTTGEQKEHMLNNGEEEFTISLPPPFF